MKFRLITLAAMMAAGSAHALSPADIDAARSANTLKEVRVSGASAQRLFVASYAQSICNAADFDVFHDVDAANKVGNNYRAYSCTLSKKVGNWVAGTPVLLSKTDKGGSGAGVFPILDAAAPGVVNFINVSAATCVRTANPTPAADILKASYTCAANVISVTPDAGVSDVEPAIMVKPVNGGATQATTQLDVKAANLSLFGIAVNKTLYRALQEQQGIIAPGGAMIDVPADQGTWDATVHATIPSLPEAFVTSALSGKLSGSSTTVPGWDVVVSSAVDAGVASKQVNVCRREVGSGTQAAAQLHFLNNPAAVGTGAIAPAADNGVPITAVGTLAVKADSSTGNLVSNCLTPAESAGGYALGIVSRENNPRANGGNAVYRFVKLNGVVPHPELARDGSYSYLYAATMQLNKTLVPLASDLGKFIVAMRAGAGVPASMAAFDVDNKYGYLALPSTYTGLYSAQTNANVLKFGARVERTSTPAPNSITPLRLVK